MDDRNDVDKLDEVMLPGFRFHPTDEELVGFYLKRKIQQRPLSIELIKQLDIYKFDPWDLPKLASTGEKEWYFYCPRDRKYRNSARPNRVTGAGFWKATGTDRPIYSSEGNKCIGLKKSLVFYKGRAAKGIKTDWMMHEFRLPSLGDTTPAKRFTDGKTIAASDSWAICRIFKKTNSTAQRALSHSWVSPFPEPTISDTLTKGSENSQSLSLLTETSSTNQMNYNNLQLQHSPSAAASFFPFEFSFNKPTNSVTASHLHVSNGDLTSNFSFSPVETLIPAKCTADACSMLLNMSSSMLGDFGKARVLESVGYSGSQDHCTGFSSLPPIMQGEVAASGDESSLVKNVNTVARDEWESTIRSVGLPLSFPVSMGDAWKPAINSLWDSSPCPSDQMSTSFCTYKSYT